MQNILWTPHYCQVSPQTLRWPLPDCHCSCAGCGNHNTSNQPRSEPLISHATHHVLSETVCKNKTTNGLTFAPLICWGPSVLQLSSADETDGEPSSGKKITPDFASELASLLGLLTDSSGQTSTVSLMHFIIPCQIFSINFTHIIPA